MTERQLECFLCIARTLSFSETASRLHLSQPAVSQQIRALEEYVGVPLLLRSKHSVALTPAGVSFYADAQELLLHRRTMCLRAQNTVAGYNELLTVACMMSLARLPEILKRYRVLYPNVLVSISPIEQNTRNPLFFYRSADVSIAFGDPSFNYGEHQFYPLYTGGFVCLLRRDHPLAERTSIRIEDLQNEVIFTLPETLQDTMLHDLRNYLLAKHTNRLMNVGASLFDLAALSAAGYGVTIAPKLLQQHDSDCVSIPFEYPGSFHLGLFISSHPRPEVEAFCRITCELCTPQHDILQY